MPPREWAMAKAQFAVIFGERFGSHDGKPPHTQKFRSPDGPTFLGNRSPA